MDYKISISGAQAQGKSTLLNRLSMCPFLAEKNFQFQTSSVRDIKRKYNIDINEAGGELTQALVTAQHIEYAFRPGNWILDRCILDSVCYGLANKITFNTAIFCEVLEKYSLMFYIKPELPLVADGMRSINKEYFDRVVEQFDSMIKYLDVVRSIGGAKMIELSGTVEQRYNTVIDNIKKLYA